MGRPAVVPPAGRGRGAGALLPGRWRREGGALSLKAPEWVRTERTRSLPGGERPGWAAKAGKGGRLGDRSPTWGTPRALVDREDSILTGRWAA